MQISALKAPNSPAENKPVKSSTSWTPCTTEFFLFSFYQHQPPVHASSLFLVSDTPAGLVPCWVGPLQGWSPHPSQGLNLQTR